MTLQIVNYHQSELNICKRTVTFNIYIEHAGVLSMLELRPCCENCAALLPPESSDAMICTFECTFCRACVQKLSHICPNCGGGFESRPVRPANNWRNGNYLGDHPAISTVTHKPVDFEAHEVLLEAIGQIPPRSR